MYSAALRIEKVEKSTTYVVTQNTQQIGIVAFENVGILSPTARSIFSAPLRRSKNFFQPLTHFLNFFNICRFFRRGKRFSTSSFSLASSSLAVLLPV